MGRYDIITGKIKESLDQKINRKILNGYTFSGQRSVKCFCEICGDEIPKGWLNGENDFLVCQKKSCWEKFLPPDLVEKFLKSKSRYDLIKET
jgi:hypothetical protein